MGYFSLHTESHIVIILFSFREKKKSIACSVSVDGNVKKKVDPSQLKYSANEKRGRIKRKREKFMEGRGREEYFLVE